MSQQRPTIVAIAGPSGAGKTTLVQRVAALLDGATQVYFDDYAATSTYVSDMATWIATGADPDAWRTPRLAQDVQALRVGTAVLHPNGIDRLDATPYIVLEEPFGRQRTEMAPLIDVVVCVDLPLEIALARRIGRDIQRMRTETATPEAIVAHIEEYLRWYQSIVRQLYLVVQTQVRAHCDLVVDGTAPVDDLACQIAHAVHRRVRDRTGHGDGEGAAPPHAATEDQQPPVCRGNT